MKNNSSRVRISFAAHVKPAPVAGFIIYRNNSVSSMSRIYNYRMPRLVKAKQGWYIKYYYRIPVAIKHLYNDKTWYPFRFTEDMNRRKGADREEYAAWLLDAVADMLKNGYNPFDNEKQMVKSHEYLEEKKEDMNITDAMLLFLEKWKEKGIEQSSYNKYERYINRFIQWLKTKKIPYAAAVNITEEHVEQFLKDMKRTQDFGNREYNNHLLFLRTAFNYLVKKKIIPESPAAGVEKQKSKSTKHRYFDDKALDQITRAMKEKDPYLYLIFQTVYYLCLRSDKEIRGLKIENIKWETNRVLRVISKTDENYIPMVDTIKKLLSDFTDGYPGNYYVFGPWGKPSEEMSSHGLFAKKFQRLRDAIGMSDQHTLYGAKHTRVIHLKSDGVSDADIMSLTGHKTFTGYATYLRDLGLTADADKLSKASRTV